MAENRSNMQRYAMLLGTYMGIFWMIKFTLFPLGMRMPTFSLLFVALTLCVPFLGYHFVRLYRNTVCGGVIGFLHAWAFTTFMYFFAALLAAVAHFIYFRFLDHGFLLEAYQSQVEALFEQEGAVPPSFEEMLRQAIDAASRLTPIDIVLQLLWSNVFFGIILAIPTALVVMRRRKRDDLPRGGWNEGGSM
ncbi:MAG: DUF4199 domain-containing protein [Prevotellaceae bacterium]|nr:DUF4199 domain-containing protein [Prevotellaceae bacterium]